MNIPDLNFTLVLTEHSLEQEKSLRDYQILKKLFISFSTSAASQGLKHGINALQVGLGPLSMVASPAIAIGQVASSINKTMCFYDLKNAASTNKCTCRYCGGIIQFIIDKREKKVAKIGIASSVVGMPFVAAHGLLRNTYKIVKGIKGKEREEYAKQLLISAKPKGTVTHDISPLNMSIKLDITKKGCPIAQACIALLLKEPNKKSPKESAISYPKTIAAINANNSWLALKQAMN